MTQAVTPELRQWILAQSQSGFAAEQIRVAMLGVGWDDALASQALNLVLLDHNLTEQHEATLPPAVAVPQPALTDAPWYIDTSDRRVPVLSRIAQPPIVVFGDVLSQEECDALIAAAQPRMARSLTVSVKNGGEEVHEDRTSRGMFFRRNENEVVARVERRLAELVNWPIENGEGLQILHYRPGAEYKPHYDYFDPAEPGTASILKRGGQRVATIIMYLSASEKGGGTVFPDVHCEVAPQRGNAVFFSYDRAHPSSKSLHGGTPVIAGEKWIATKWLRERRFE